MDLGPHALFIWLCYAAVAIVVAALIVGQWAEGARLKRELADLDAQSGRRASTGEARE